MYARGVGNRTAAAIALLAGAGVLIALVLLVIRSSLAVLAALTMLAVAGYAVWVAATRRNRTMQLAAAGGALLALGAGAFVLVKAGAVDELILAAVSFLVFAYVAPKALAGGDRARPGPADVPRAARREARVLIVNPRSGDGRAARFGLVDEAERRGIETVVLMPGDDLVDLAEDAAGRADVIGMAGGDGSQALVAGIASAHEIAFVCVPAGTRNHFALDLGVDRDDVVGALDAFGWGSERRVDLANVNGRTFVNNVSLGVYAEIVRSDAYRAEKLATARQMLPDLIGPDSPPLPLHVESPDGTVGDHVRLILVSNNPYVLGGLVGIGARPKLDTGKLGIVVVEVEGPGDAAKLASFDAVGQVRRFRGWHEWTAESLVVDGTESLATGIDGEAIELEPPLRFAVASGALRVRVVPWTDNRVAARGPSREVLSSLWGVASGARAQPAPSSASRRDDT